ncbi:uncharacterized protein LOC107628194 isoform X2 [Arachis ipaensis]|uniref:uncharacterized protein LOC107628194 isoform X2 n=1 Tax=Arachis ipaensis TaxID=130454 RepID=UPI0007AF5946|nr:uncharacterized protein LOC107628194 isoform X2 [Arachis ipaensis]XP_025632188.1 uncharacterized protein LOC112726864 isoform X2 [Arachis hypogaea]
MEIDMLETMRIMQNQQWKAFDVSKMLKSRPENQVPMCEAPSTSTEQGNTSGKAMLKDKVVPTEKPPDESTKNLRGTQKEKERMSPERSGNARKVNGIKIV